MPATIFGAITVERGSWCHVPARPERLPRCGQVFLQHKRNTNCINGTRCCHRYSTHRSYLTDTMGKRRACTYLAAGILSSIAVRKQDRAPRTHNKRWGVVNSLGTTFTASRFVPVVPLLMTDEPCKPISGSRECPLTLAAAEPTADLSAELFHIPDVLPGSKSNEPDDKPERAPCSALPFCIPSHAAQQQPCNIVCHIPCIFYRIYWVPCV